MKKLTEVNMWKMMWRERATVASNKETTKDEGKEKRKRMGEHDN